MVHETALHQLIMDQLIILGTFLWAVRTLIYLEDFFYCVYSRITALSDPIRCKSRLHWLQSCRCLQMPDLTIQTLVANNSQPQP